VASNEIDRVSKFDNSLSFGAKQNALRQIFFALWFFKDLFTKNSNGIFFDFFLFCVGSIKECIYVYLSMQIQKKDVYEHSCSSVRAFLSILAHSAHLACFFSLILNRIKKMFWFKHTNTRKHVSEQSWLSGWIILNISAHLAHLAQSYYSLIFSTTNANNCFWFDLTNKKKISDWR